MDYTNDGAINRVTKYTVDVQGRQLSSADYNQLADGSLVQIQREEYTLDGNGNRIGMTRYLQGSDTPSVIQTYEVDALGNSVKAYFDNNADNTVDIVEVYTIDANGRVERKDVVNTTNHNEILSSTEYIRNALGQDLEYREYDANGKVQKLVISEFDEYGNRTSMAEYSADDATSENLIRKREWLFNEFKQASDTILTNPDGTQTHWKRTFNEYGIMDYEAADRGNDGTIEYQTFIKEYDDQRRLTKVFYDMNANDIFDSGDYIQKREYNDTFDRLAKVSEYKDEALTQLSVQTEYEFNEIGQYTVAMRDQNGDGKIDRFLFTAGVGYTPVNHVENVAEWDETRLAKGLAINQYHFSNSSEGILIFDKEVLSRFTANNIYILDGTDNDKVVLLNGKTDFTKSGEDVVVNNRTYDVYSTSEGKSLYILNDITVDVDSNGVI